MITLRELYRIGHGPSSSHTMGPRKAATQFLEKYDHATHFNVTLYGSLAAGRMRILILCGNNGSYSCGM